MRNHLAMIVSGMLVWTSAVPEHMGVAQGQAEAGKPANAKTEATETVKPEAACGFCLADGMKVPLTLGRELSSGIEVTGNRVDFEVSLEIRVEGVLVIPKGSMAYGTIVEAQGRRRMGRAGKLNVRIDEVRMADGERTKLRAVQESKGKGRQAVVTGALIASGVLFFPVAPMFLFIRGKDVVIAKGAPVTAYIDGNTVLERVKFENIGD